MASLPHRFILCKQSHTKEATHPKAFRLRKMFVILDSDNLFFYSPLPYSTNYYLCLNNLLNSIPTKRDSKQAKWIDRKTLKTYLNQ